MTLLDNMKHDTSVLLDEWGESLSVARASVSWDAGKAVTNYPVRGTVVGDWQPVSGRTVREEEGRAVKSDAQVIIRSDEDIQEGDRIYRPDGTFMYVNYIKKFEDHWTVLLTRTEPK